MAAPQSPSGVDPKRIIPPYVPPGGGGGGGSTDPLVWSGAIAGEPLSVGQVVYYDQANGGVMRARSVPQECVAVGVAKTAAAAQGDSIDVYIAGIFPVRFDGAPAAGNNGAVCYLSSTLGRATMTPPVLGPNVARAPLGILLTGDGANLTPDVLWRPGDIIYGA